MSEKDTNVYRKIIKSQHCTHTEVCEVIHELFNDRIVCKLMGKHYFWYIKINDNLIQSNELDIRKMIFRKTINTYHQTIKFLYDNAFDDDCNLIKYHYIDIANRLIKITKSLNMNPFKNSVMRELKEVMCS